MTDLAAELPTLSWGREQTQAWTHAALSLGELLRRRRETSGREAWSDAEDSARRHEQVLRAAEPTVRSMTVQERELFDARRGDPAAEDLVTRVVDGDDWSVTVTAGRFPDENGWGLAAYGRSKDGTDISSTLVRCADESTAMELGEQLLKEGPPGIERLSGFAELAAARARAASSEVTESEPQRLARTAATVRQVWPRELAERVIGPTPVQYQRGERWNPAFGALAWRLHEMEERGFEMAAVLRRIDHRRLMGKDVINPAALAEFFVEEMGPGVKVINLDSEEFTRPHAGPGPDSAPHERATSPGKVEQEQTVAPLLAAAMSEEVLGQVRRSPGYEGLRQDLFDQYEKGRPVAELLSQLPIERIRAADKPAQYLRAVIDRRIEEGRPVRTGLDRNAQAELLRAHLGGPAAEKVISGSAWPGLAKRLDAWQHAGIPVEALLEQLPEGRVAAARNPAAYTTALLNAKVRAHQSSTPQEPDSRAGRDHGSPGKERPQQSSGSRRAERQFVGSPTEVVEHATSADLPRVEDLDPANPVDRVGLDVVAGLDGSRRQPNRNESAAAAVHGAAAAAAEGRAAEHELHAAHHRGTVADSGQPGDQNHDHEGAARVDDNLAAGERAIAAEERGAEAEAAARAEVAYTPAAGNPTSAVAAAGKRSSGPQRPVRQQRAGQTQERGRTR